MRQPSEILARAQTIAVVGASRDPAKTAHTVPAQMARHGWTIIPVNPHGGTIFGVPVYRSLADVPVPVDLVNVFRPSEAATPFVREAIEIGAPAVWLQLGISSPEGRRLAEAAGIDYVEDTCIAVVRAVHELSRAA